MVVHGIPGVAACRVLVVCAWLSPLALLDGTWVLVTLVMSVFQADSDLCC